MSLGRTDTDTAAIFDTSGREMNTPTFKEGKRTLLEINPRGPVQLFNSMTLVFWTHFYFRLVLLANVRQYSDKDHV
jgi:hypothetical protein